ncbi:MAG: dihydroorotate dehydrogenase electron transfer subunit [Anaerohalosphaeraceae bacterium]
MKSEHKPGSKALVQALVTANEPIRPRFWKLLLKLDPEGSRLFSKALPGQFAQFDLSHLSLPPAEAIEETLRDRAERTILLRRPFSFSDIFTSYSEQGTYVCLEVIYCVLGPATVRMTSLKPGDCISLIGPLGNGFWYPETMKNALLVTGGMGAPPILHLASFLRKSYPHTAVTAFAGARSIDYMPFELKIGNITGATVEEFERLNIPVHLATDDGSVGRKGFVTELLKEWIEKQKPNPEQTVIYACGPEPMLAACAEIAFRTRILCQVSMERMMACGIGLCQSCAVRIRTDKPESPIYQLCCKDGPVFDSRTVIFGEGQ